MADTLTRIGAISAALALAIGGMFWVRTWALQQPSRRGPTWGCGYDAPNRRMQYSGSSFSSDLLAWFRSVVVMVRREKDEVVAELKGCSGAQNGGDQGGEE